MRNLHVNFTRTGYGQWKASTNYYGKEISAHFTDAPTYDLINGDDERKSNAAKKRTRLFIIRKHKESL